MKTSRRLLLPACLLAVLTLVLTPLNAQAQLDQQVSQAEQVATENGASPRNAKNYASTLGEAFGTQGNFDALMNAAQQLASRRPADAAAIAAAAAVFVSPRQAARIAAAVASVAPAYAASIAGAVAGVHPSSARAVANAVAQAAPGADRGAINSAVAAYLPGDTGSDWGGGGGLGSGLGSYGFIGGGGGGGGGTTSSVVITQVQVVPAPTPDS